MDSRASLASQESTTHMKMISPRRRPLHTLAVTISVISNRAFSISQGLNGPLGLIINFAARLATLAGPFAFALHHQWLTMAIVSFIDNQILAFEDVIERIYPPSHIVFNKIDDLVRVTESLPGKFDNFVSRYHIFGYVSHFSLLDWMLVRVISLLNFVGATLSYWRLSKCTKEEKEIKVDTSNNVMDRINEPGLIREVDWPKERTTNIKDPRGGQHKSDHIMFSPLKGATYKDVLLQKANCQGGIIMEKEEKINNTKDKEVAASVGDDDSERNSKDDLLKLFESAWLMTSPGRRAKGNYTPRSASFTY